MPKTVPVPGGGLAGVVAGAPGCWGAAGATTSGRLCAPASGGADASRAGELDTPASRGTCSVTDGDGVYRGRDTGLAVGAGGSRVRDAGSGAGADDTAAAEVDALDGRRWVPVRRALAGAGARRGGAPFAAAAGTGCRLTG